MSDNKANLGLIHECNKLRQENEQLKAKVKKLTARDNEHYKEVEKLKRRIEVLELDKKGLSSIHKQQIQQLKKELEQSWQIEHLTNPEQVKAKIIECEGRHVQQVAYSSYHDTLSQICFTCKKVRTNLKR